ncbi:M56 family metallopeptidase, partial [Mucilaginibacter sp.]|uniref:M56 family metallopeptidase n=1 Tax=Mucilaginibacter sp. TaxID=1882438 RepID=UPI002ED370E2
MINNLISFSLCSGLLLIIYQMLLKGKTLYTFNRYYLLFSMLFSLVVPFIGIESNIPIVDVIKPVKDAITFPSSKEMWLTEPQPQMPASHTVTTNDHINYWRYCLLALYISGVLILLFRFVRNLYIIKSIVKNGECLSYERARLVLVENSHTPHTFLNIIFLNKHDYHSKNIEKAILKHELTHARQLHSIDIILIELLQAVCWFNPFIPFYRKAIELNHEFIADAAAIDNTTDITSYQYLLLNTANQSNGLSITSQFNYLIIKKRLIMMTRSTPAINAIWTKIVTVPVFISAFLLFCSKTEAFTVFASVKNPTPIIEKALGDTTSTKQSPYKLVASNYPYTKDGASLAALKEYQQTVEKYFEGTDRFIKHPAKITVEDRAKLETIFKSMSRAQQENQMLMFTYQGEPLKAKHPSQADLEIWRTSSTSRVWINDKKVNNSELNNYSPSDFGLAIPTRLTKKSINYKKYRYEITLYTNDYYAKLYKKQMDERYLSVML